VNNKGSAAGQLTPASGVSNASWWRAAVRLFCKKWINDAKAFCGALLQQSLIDMNNPDRWSSFGGLVPFRQSAYKNLRLVWIDTPV
jgi:hypothetical protein